ncbi:RE1 [Symbiodinium sp. CCMP2456]|nr:RE1 [Symbiodinium sp. CCMP2456]
MGILDTGATQDLIGTVALKSLEEELGRSGLRVIDVPTTGTAPSGIGGSAKIVRAVLVPTSPGGIPGVVQFAAIEGNIPPLLSVGLMEHLGTQLDLVSNRIHFRNIGVDAKMVNLPSGHRALPLVQWPGGRFPVPQTAKAQYGLADDAFMKDGSIAQMGNVTATGGVNVVANRWRQMIVRMLYLFEALRTRYFHLAQRENNDKSIFSERRKYLVGDAQAPAKCLHPQPHIARANQYATWTVCPKCNARQTYVSKRNPTAKSKARARSTVAPHAVISPDMVDRTAGAFRPAARMTVFGARSSSEVPNDTIHPELNATLQAMAASFQNVGEVTRGQGQMLMMMQRNAEQDMRHLTVREAQELARQEIREMQVDSNGSEEWSPVNEALAPLDDGAAPVPVVLSYVMESDVRASAAHCGSGLYFNSPLLDEAPVDYESKAQVIRMWALRSKANYKYDGPFWMIRAPRLHDEILPNDVDSHVNLEELKRAEGCLVELARNQHREATGSQVDFVEIFNDTAAADRAQSRGLRVPASHENFTYAAGWSAADKLHRRRLRHFMEHRRPGVVAMRWSSENQPTGPPRERVEAGVNDAMALEIATLQLEQGRSFYVRAPADSSLWTQVRWLEMARSPAGRVRVSKDGDYIVATNMDTPVGGLQLETNYEDGQAPTSTTSVSASTVESDPGERLAAQLLQQADFSQGARLKLLRETKWPRQRLRRRSMNGSENYQVLGQYSYGKFAGLTLATYRLPNTLRYLNHFLTRHGALGTRSSIVVSRNAQVEPHRDMNNIGQNHSIALGQFKGGELWQEHPQGQVYKEVNGVKVPGVLRKHRGRVISFDPRQLHSVEPWEGERWAITAFTTRSAAHLNPEQESLLRNFGFEAKGEGHRANMLVAEATDELIDQVWKQTSGAPRAVWSFPSTTMDETEADVEDLGAAEYEPVVRNAPLEQEPQVSQQQRDLIKKLHINTGHPPADRFLRTLKAAGALPHVLKYVRDKFVCETCQVKRGPDPRRKAQCPRIFTFNKVLSMDVFYVPFRDSLEPVLNVVCHGTNYQLAQRIESTSGAPSAQATWRALLNTWVRYLGAPSLSSRTEARSFKEDSSEGSSSLEYFTMCWLKQKLVQELDSGRGVVTTREDLDELLSSLVAAKNRWYNHGGYTPTQLIFGELPRVPGELLSSEDASLQVLSDAFHDPAGMDEAATEYKKRHEIRERGRQLAMEEASRETIKRAARRGKSGDALHPTSRWVGPGIVVMQTPSVVWVAMRTRLWRCSPEQLRQAFPSEVLGRQLASDPELSDLLRQVVSGAVDVTKELPPNNEEQFAPVDRGSEAMGGSAIGEATSSTSPAPLEPPQAPRQPVEVPPGLERHLQTIHEDATLRPELQQPLPNAVESRRSSIQEPAQEPEATGDGRAPSGSSELPGLTPGGEVAQERPPKVPRLEPIESSENTLRAPGTPIRRLLQAVQRGRRQQDGGEQQGDESRSRSRTPEEARGHAAETDGATWYCYQEKTGWNLVASRSDEVNVKKLSQEEQEKFHASDKVEWDAILKTKAVRVVYGKEAQKLRELYPERILASRMVRRKKPLPGMHQWKAKSRWCIAGHSDPDTEHLTTFAPTPSTEGMMAFLHTGLGLGHSFSFCDVKNAFCQSNPLRRPRGPLFAQPTDGLGLPPDALIIIDVPVYGLDDAPAAWRSTVVSYLVKQNFIRNIVEPCWYMKFDQAGNNVAQILIEVDDFIVSAQPSLQNEIKELLHSHFVFGKWEEGTADYAGRKVCCHEDRITVDQEKYILEQITPIPLAKHRKALKEASLTEEEFQAMRSAVYKINWVAKETRPEMSGLASIMASKLKTATIDDILIINKNINYLRTTASRPLILWKVDPRDSAFIAVSDAGGVGVKHEVVDDEGLPTDHTQGAWVVLIAEELPLGNRRVRASPIAWRSSKLKRKVFSTFGGETQAMLQGISEIDWMQIMVRDATAHDVKLKEWRNSLSPHMLVMRSDCEMRLRQPQCAVTDAKSLYDCILKEHPQGKQDRRSSLELAIIVKDLQETRSTVRWVPHQKMLADAMTKPDPLKANGALEQMLKTGVFSLVDVSEELANRASDSRFRARSHGASAARLLREYEQSGYLTSDELLTGRAGSSADKPPSRRVVCATSDIHQTYTGAAMEGPTANPEALMCRSIVDVINLFAAAALDLAGLQMPMRSKRAFALTSARRRCRACCAGVCPGRKPPDEAEFSPSQAMVPEPRARRLSEHVRVRATPQRVVPWSGPFAEGLPSWRPACDCPTARTMQELPESETEMRTVFEPRIWHEDMTHAENRSQNCREVPFRVSCGQTIWEGPPQQAWMLSHLQFEQSTVTSSIIEPCDSILAWSFAEH